MAERSEDMPTIQITKPGILALGAGLPTSQSTAALFENNTVLQISCGEDHSAVVLASGQVYMFGKNVDSGWMKSNTNFISPPELVASLNHVRIMQAACGNQFTLFLTDKGNVYSCGVNADGQLGLGHTSKCPMPASVEGLQCIKKVAAGCRHSLVLSDNGEVWGAGCNQNNQLGISPNHNKSSFVHITNLPVIIDIACGNYFSVLLSTSHVILVTGSNHYNQLGLEGNNQCNFTQTSIPSKPIAALTCGSRHTIALRWDGSVWAWGANSCCQLGSGIKSETLDTPTPVLGLDGYTISTVIAGYDHTALLTSEGDVLLLGRGKNGELGNETKDNVSVPMLLKKSPELIVKQVAFAETYSLLLIGSKVAESAATHDQSEVKKQATPSRALISEMEDNIMKSLECPVCFKIMCPPIHQCSNGHSVCATCRSSTPNCSLCRESYTSARSLNLENLSTVLHLPCVDCLERMPANLLEMHGDVCPYRKYNCPVQQVCGWRGRPDAILGHTSSSHPDQTWQDLPRLFVHKMLDEGVTHVDILSAHGEVFTLHRRYDKNTSKFQTFVRYLGLPENVKHFMFKVAFIKDDYCDKVTFLKNVGVDTENVDLLYESDCCVSLKKDLLVCYLTNSNLVCEVAVLKGAGKHRNDRIKSLLGS